jgi:hypothetical protein
LATSQRKVSTQFSGVPSGAQYGRRFLVLCSARKRELYGVMPRVVWSHNTTVCRATNFTPFRLLFGVEVVLPEEIKHQSLCTTTEAPSYPNRSRRERFAGVRQAQGGNQFAEVSRRDKILEGPEGQEKRIQYQQLSPLADPSDRELQ